MDINYCYSQLNIEQNNLNYAIGQRDYYASLANTVRDEIKTLNNKINTETTSLNKYKKAKETATKNYNKYKDQITGTNEFSDDIESIKERINIDFYPLLLDSMRDFKNGGYIAGDQIIREDLYKKIDGDYDLVNETIKRILNETDTEIERLTNLKDTEKRKIDDNNKNITKCSNNISSYKTKIQTYTNNLNTYENEQNYQQQLVNTYNNNVIYWQNMIYQLSY